MTTRRNQFRFSRVDTSAKRFNYAASRQGSSAVEQGTHKPLVGSSILPPGTPLLFLFRNVGREIFFVSAQRRHETNAVRFLHHSGPAFLFNKMPAVEMFRRAGFHVALG